MNKWFKPVLLAGVVALGSSAVMAQAGPGMGGMGPGGGPRAQQARGNPDFAVERMELRLARLEIALGIQPAQQSAWEQFKKSAMERAAQNGKRFQTMWDRNVPKTAAERYALMEENAKARLENITNARKAAETFYSKLTDAQQKVFDAEFAQVPFAGRGNNTGAPGGWNGPGMRHHRGMGMGNGPGTGPCYMRY